MSGSGLWHGINYLMLVAIIRETAQRGCSSGDSCGVLRFPESPQIVLICSPGAR